MLLIKNSSPLVLDRQLACVLGLNETMVLGQIHYWLQVNRRKNKNFHEGRYWTYNTVKDWQKEFPFWSESTVKRTLRKLRDMGLLVVNNFNVYRMDRTLWYSIDYEKLEEMICTAIGSDKEIYYGQCELMDEVDEDPAIPETSSEISPEMGAPYINHEEQYKDDRGWMDRLNTKYEEIIDKCELYAIDEKYRKGVAYAIKLLLLDVYSSDKVQIGRFSIPSRIVYKDLEDLNIFVIEHAIYKFKEASDNFRIQNPIAYIKTCIYNAIHEVDIATDSNLRYNNVI